VFVAYQVVNIFSFVFNCHGKSLPLIAQISLYTSLLSFVVILITVPAVAPTHQHAKFVFATFINSTGWNSGGIAFIVGLINTNWGFSCLDTAVHLAEEVHQPERMVPIAIMGTVIIGFVTSWFFSMSMMFSINHFAKIANSATGVPMLELFFQALQNRAGAIVLESLVIATGFGCMIACQTWASRLCWSFARDGGVPGHKWLGKVHEKLDVPLNAHLVNSVIVAALGCLYIASYAAINAIISACIVLPYVSYSIPIICLLIRGRNNIHHGPFWLGMFGHVSNYVTLAWILFTFVM
jgi:choline transport protein